MKTIFHVSAPYAQNIRFVFVKDPALRGRYIRTDRCVAAVPCAHEDCGAAVGELCKGANGKPRGCTHHVRRAAFQALEHARNKARKRIPTLGQEVA